MKTTLILKILGIGLHLIGMTQATVAQQRGDNEMKKEYMVRMYDRWPFSRSPLSTSEINYRQDTLWIIQKV